VTVRRMCDLRRCTRIGPLRGMGLLSAAAAGLVAAGLFATGGSAVGAAAGGQTFTVDVDGANKAANESFTAYFPNVVRVHAGDTVVFHEVGNGEPHTVTLGTLANGAVAAFEKLSPKQQQNPPKAAVRADAKVPSLFPQGPGDAVQSVANPCYLATGAPSAAACPASAQPAFTGTETYVNSGWLDANAHFAVHLAPTIAPGTYRFMCALHREGMSGRIVVEPPGTAVASPAAQFAAGRRQLRAIERKLAPAVQDLRRGRVFAMRPPGKVVFAGSGSPAAGQEAGITEFGPKVVRIPVGGSVTWYLLGDHTITFNANKSNDDIRATAPDGSVHLNAAALSPAGGPGEPHGAPGGGSGGGRPTFKVVAASRWNGRGFHNSGIFLNSFGPPLIEGYKMTFTRAGSYRYICTVHDRMRGTVVVG